MEEKNKKGLLKEFKLSSASIKNKMTVYVLTGIILVAGIGTYTSMSRESFPEVVIPQIYVGTPYPGNSAADIEKLVTRPLEKEIKSISGIDKMTSTSVQGYSTIFIEFDFIFTSFLITLTMTNKNKIYSISNKFSGFSSYILGLNSFKSYGFNKKKIIRDDAKT